jgi:tripartite-type tricarboxylate transporter receptor subunit TctC
VRTIGRRSFIKSAGSLTLAGGLLPKLAFAQEKWPDRVVRFIVPLAAGGAIDFVARQCSQVLTQALGQQFIVENRTGAGGTIGMDTAWKATPDGYTILITNDNAASAPHILKLDHDYTKVLLPVIDIAHQPQIFAAHPSLGVSTVKEFVDYVKKNPGFGFATSGVGSNQHVIGEWFAKEAGLKMEHVPYRGAGQAVTDLLAGHVKCAFLGPTSMIPHWKAGNLKFLAQSGAKRASTLTEIPTILESGYKVELEAWYAAFAPPGMPPALVKQIHDVIKTALSDKMLVENFSKGSLEVVGGTPEELDKLAKSDSLKYERLVRELNISAG